MGFAEALARLARRNPEDKRKGEEEMIWANMGQHGLTWANTLSPIEVNRKQPKVEYST